MRRTFIGLLMLLAVACTHEADQQVHPPPKQGTPANAADLASQDREFLERAAKGNNAEIAIGGLADERAKSGEVLSFGRLMVTEHRAIDAQLASVARRRNIVLPTSLGDHQVNYDRLVGRRFEPFDSEFARVMIADHQMAVELYRGAATSAVDPEIRAFAAATLPRIEAHLAHAKSMKALAQPPQELTRPPTPDATQPPRPSAFEQEPK